MRNRFKPNLTSTPRGRKSQSSNQNVEEQPKNERSFEKKETAVNASSGNGEVSGSLKPKGADVPFIPPHCKGINTTHTEDTTVPEKLILESTSPLVSSSTVVGIDVSVAPSLSSSSPARSSRRTRIKPAVTPVTRSQPASARKEKGSDGKNREKSKDGSLVKDSVSSSGDESITEKTILEPGPPVALNTTVAENGTNAITPPSSSSSSLSSATRSGRRPRIKPAVTPVGRPQRKEKGSGGEDDVKSKGEGATSSQASPGSTSKRKSAEDKADDTCGHKDSGYTNTAPVTPKRKTAVVEGEQESSVMQELTDEPSNTVQASNQRHKRLRSMSQGEKVTEPVEMSNENGEGHDNPVEEDEEEGRKKGLKRRRGGRPHKLKEPTDPSQMTMQHLIYFNPKTNPMKSTQDSKKKKIGGRNKRARQCGDEASNSQELESRDQVTTDHSAVSTPSRTTEQVNETVADDSTADATAVAPRVKLSADGSIILDEESLLIPKSPQKSLDNSEIVYEDGDQVNYTAYLKWKKVEKWTMEETEKFYKALSQVGTDFSLMLPLFPNRQRKELKAKFKREEKAHRSLIEKALRARNPIDVELFTPRVEGEELDGAVASNEINNITNPAPEPENAEEQIDP